MKYKSFLAAVAAIFCSATFANAGHPYICCDNPGNKVAEVSESGEVKWSYPCTHPQDCWKLSNGNLLFCHKSGAVEFDQEKKIVWEYKAPEKTEVHACQPLPGNLVMIVECGASRIIEVDRNGKIQKEIKLSTTTTNVHDQFRGTRKLKNGNYQVCFKGEHKVVELDSNGKVLKSIKVPGDAHEVLSLPDGHLLVTCGDGHAVVELDSDEKVVWELKENDIPGNPLRLMAGCQRLPNGNTVFCNYLGHGHIGKQPQVFELTRDKKIVWQVEDHTNFKSINQIQLLDVAGDATNWEILR